MSGAEFVSGRQKNRSWTTDFCSLIPEWLGCHLFSECESSVAQENIGKPVLVNKTET